MKLKKTKKETDLSKANCVWKPWFAWYPVYIDGTWVWLERVETRRIYNLYNGFARVWVRHDEYRLP